MTDLRSLILRASRAGRGLVVVGLLAGGLLLVGCGGDAEDAADAEPEPTDAEIDDAVAAGDFDAVETDELTAEGNPRTRHQWVAAQGEQTFEVDLVIEDDVDGGRLTVLVTRPML